MANSFNPGNTMSLDSGTTGNIKQIAKTTQGLAKTAEKQMVLVGREKSRP